MFGPTCGIFLKLYNKRYFYLYISGSIRRLVKPIRRRKPGDWIMKSSGNRKKGCVMCVCLRVDGYDEEGQVKRMNHVGVAFHIDIQCN